MPRRVIEIAIAGINLLATGSEADETRHLVAASLVWPRPGIAERVALKPVTLTRGAYSYNDASWVQRILFKESVLGPLGIEITVSRALDPDGLRRAVAEFAESFAKEGAAHMDSMFGGTVGGLVKLPLSFLAGRLDEAPDREPPLVAAGEADMPADALSPGTVLSVPLIAPVTVYRARRRRPPAPARGNEIAVEKDGANGEVQLVVR